MKVLKVFLAYSFAGLIALLTLNLFSSYWIKAHTDALQRARLILESNSRYGWRQKINLDSVFEGAQVKTDENGFRMNSQFKNQPINVITLGPSSAFGWGVGQSQTFTDLLSSQNADYSTLNAGEIGYTLIQGRKLFKELYFEKKLRPKFIIVSYGINEMDRFRFYGRSALDDLNYFNTKVELPWYEIDILARQTFLQLAIRAFDEFTISICGPGVVLDSRVSLDQFKSQLAEFILELKSLAITPILMTTAFHPKTPLQFTDPQKSKFLYMKSQSEAEQKQCSKAKKYAMEARNYETARILSEVRELNDIVKAVATTLKTDYVDVEHILMSDDLDTNFFDPVHPSVTGHRKIYQSVLKNLSNFKGIVNEH